MKINYNLSAIIANSNLNKSDSRMSASLEKLSSGYRLNRSKDNPSSFAIARKMRSQIEGLKVANANSVNGVSVIETMEGTLTEIQSMLQRMNELAVKGSNGTMTTSDRKALVDESQQLMSEINRLAKDTEFNELNILDGSFDLKGYSDKPGINVDYYSDETTPKNYKVEITAKAVYDAQGKVVTDAVVNLTSDFPPGTRVKCVGDEVFISGPNKFDVRFTIDSSYVIQPPGNQVTVGAASAANTVTFDTAGTTATPGASSIAGSWTEGTWTSPSGDYKFEVTRPTEYTGGNVTNIPQISLSSDFPPDSNITYSGNKAIVTSAATGLKMEFAIDNTYVFMQSNTDVTLDLTGMGAMQVQIGTSKGQTLNMRLPEISLHKMKLDDIDFTTMEGCREAIEKVSDGSAYISEVRSRLGAYQNRLEHSAASLDVTEETMTSAYGRIMDTNMAKEMTEYTKFQVMSQAGTSMLAQANERPQKVLQLLQ